jgi:hypothetical protein
VVGREAPFHPDDNSRGVIQVEVPDARALLLEESPTSVREGISFTSAAYLAAVSGLADLRARPPEVRGVPDLEL